MAEDFAESLKKRVERIRILTGHGTGTAQHFEAGGLALTVIHETAGGSHPLASVLDNALKTKDWMNAAAASRALVTLYEQGGLQSPRLAVAHEIEGSLLDIAEAQAKAAEINKDSGQKQIQLAVAAFLTGAALEDALRRLCDTHGIEYDPARATISTLQAELYQPSKGVEHISKSESKQITSWGDTRNKADHGKFAELTQTELTLMLIGTRAFIDKHLP